MANVDFREFTGQVGLGSLQSITNEEIAHDFMPAAVMGLADGDFTILHDHYTGDKARVYGESFYRDGLVAKRVGKAAIENGITPGVIYDFQSLAAQYFIKMAEWEPVLAKAKSPIRIHPEAVTIDGNPLALARPPQLVIDYGACLMGRSYLDDQLAFVSQKQRPFTYSPLTRSHFVNQVLLQTYDAKYGDGLAHTMVARGLYLGREDGTGAATDEMITAQAANEAPVEVADIILCTGAQHTTKSDMERGVTNAFRLLKEDGTLILRSFAAPAAAEIGIRHLAEWAYDAGFSEKSAVKYTATLSSLGILLTTGHFGNRAFGTVVLTK